MSGSSHASRRSGRLLWLITAVIGAGAIYFSMPGRALRRAEQRVRYGHAAAPAPGAAAPIPTPPAPVSNLSPNGEEASHLADQLNSPSGDIHSDLRTVNELFDQYRSAVHGPNPTGENAEIVAVLTGKNPLGYSFVPPHHPAINAQGQLVDRWGTPFFFHQLSSDQMQIRSAGPDRILYTDDDEVMTPGLYQPHL
jgi:hypothetical protein